MRFSVVYTELVAVGLIKFWLKTLIELGPKMMDNP